MSTVFTRYLEEHNGQCPTNAHILVNYSTQQTDLKPLQWIDAHLIIEHYMLHGTILPSDSDSDESQADDDEDQHSNNGSNHVHAQRSTGSLLRTVKQRVNSMKQTMQKSSTPNYDSLTHATPNTTEMQMAANEVITHRESNHFIFDAQQYPTRERKESQLTQPCFSFVDVLGLLCCTIIIGVAGYFVLMMGISHYLHDHEYSVLGHCICTKTKLNGQYDSHLWMIYNHTICSHVMPDNYTFATVDDDTVYKNGEIVTCYTNSECDHIYVQKAEHAHISNLYLYIGSIVSVISLCCCVVTVSCYCQLLKTKKVIACGYCRDCMDYRSGRDQIDWYDSQLAVIDEQQWRFEEIVQHFMRSSNVRLDTESVELISQYYHAGRKSIGDIMYH